MSFEFSLFPLIPTDKLFTGQRLDSTGLYYYNARYYDPEIGRFISPDTFVQWSIDTNAVSKYLTVNNLDIMNLYSQNIPIKYTEGSRQKPQGLNRYSYVSNNSLKYTDPLGYWTIMLQLSAGASLYFGGTIGLGIIFDGEGNWAIITSVTATIEITQGPNIGFELSATGGIQVTNADTIWDVINTSSETQYSLTAGEGYAASVTVIDGDGYNGGGFAVGVGEGIGVTGEVEVDTNVIFSNKMLNTLSNLSIYDYLMYGMYLTNEIDTDVYTDYMTATYYGWDPAMAFLWVLMNNK